MTPHGGRRRGAGRPKSNAPKGRRVMVRFDDETYAELERIAKGQSVSVFVRKFVVWGLATIAKDS